MTISLINSQIKSQGRGYFITEELTATSKRTRTHVFEHATRDGFSRKSCSGGLMTDDENKARLCGNFEKKKKTLVQHVVPLKWKISGSVWQLKAMHKVLRINPTFTLNYSRLGVQMRG